MKDAKIDMRKKWSSDKQYDVCYLLYDAGKWGGIKGTIAQANGLVDRGYRICIVCRTPKPDWIDIRTDFIVSPNLAANDIPPSDIVVGTWYPTVAPGFSSKKGLCVHYCRGYEGHAPGLSGQQQEAIKKVYNLPTIKIANSPHVGSFLKNNFPGDVYIVRNDINHSIFYPNRTRDWGKDSIKVAVVGPYEVAWKGIRDCLKACKILSRMPGISITVVRASQTTAQTEEAEFVQDIGCPYEYRFNLSEMEMAALYNECDILISGSYPYVESFGRPAMEALACGLPVVLTDIPAYRDYDSKHDYSLFVKPGKTQDMAQAMHEVIKDDQLRKQLIERGIEVSGQYSIEKTIEDLDRSLQDIYRKHILKLDTKNAKPHYYGYTRPEIQDMINVKAHKILDIGCAAGQLGAGLKERLGAEVWGVEIVEAIAKQADKLLDKVIHARIEDALDALPDNYFDSIILADVLEHLENPDMILYKLQSKLSGGGEIVASIPNVRHWSVLKELLEGKWNYQDAGILDRTHLRFFTKKSIVSLFQTAGLQIQQMKATSLTGSEMPDDVMKALSQTTLDVSTLKDEAGHYQYIIKATIKKRTNNLVSLVILTYNEIDYTKRCLKSLQKHTPEDHEIIFVDNGSTDGTVKWLRAQVQQNPNYRLIENKNNLGFAKGCNQGIEASRGEYILLLNNDVVISDGWLAGLLECHRLAPQAGIIGPMTNNISGHQQVQDEAYRSVEDLAKYAAAFRERYRHRRMAYRRIVGFCMLFQRSLVEQIGLLDESFGTGNFEDDDLCLRATLAGYKNYIAGDVFIHHYGSRSFIGNKIHYGTALSENRKIINHKWTLSMATPEGKTFAILQAIELADAFNQKGKLSQAVETLVDCIKFAPDNSDIYYELARLFIDAKSFPEAWDVVASMPEAAKNDLKGLKCAGYIKEGLGLDDEAAALADQILSLRENDPAALNLKGVLAYKKGNKDKAGDFFAKTVEADPGYGEAYTNLGVLNWGLEKRDEAFAFLKKGFVLSPTVPDISSTYYSVATTMNQFDNAEVDFREAARLYPNNRNILFLLIDLLIQQNDFDRAIVEIENALDVFGPDEGTLSAALAVREKIGPLDIKKGEKKNTLSICMIVKNEEKHLVRCLKSVRDIADEIIVVDTGSTDKTKDIATVFGAKVFDFPWTGDFAEARNESLRHASGDWIFVLDADEALSSQDFTELHALIRKRTTSPVSYSIITRNYINDASAMGWTRNTGQYPEERGAGWAPSIKVRLVPRRPDIYFTKPVHELLEYSLQTAKIPVKPCKIVVHHYGKLDIDRDAQKGEDYYLQGKIKHESDPTNMKYIYELAKQAQQLQKHDEAVDLWHKLIALIEKDSKSSNYQELAEITFNDPLPEIFTHLARAYILMERYDDALTAAHRTLEGQIRRIEYMNIYSHCEIIAGSLDKALQSIEEQLKAKPDYPPALALLSVIYCIRGLRKEADELFQKMQEKKIDFIPTFNKIAKQLSDYGKQQEAMLLLNKAIENKVANQVTRNLLSEVQSAEAPKRT